MPQEHDSRPQADPDNPMNHPDEQPAGSDDTPRFGRLLVVLAVAVAILGVVTWASQTYLGK